MKISIATFLLIANSISETEAVNLSRAGFIDCEATGTCAPTPKRKSPEGFSANIAYTELYTSDEMSNAAEEVKAAKEQMAKKKIEDQKKQLEDNIKKQ